MASYRITDHGNGNYTVQELGEGGSADSVAVPAALFYLLGFVGMVIMLFNMPVTMLAFGILAMLIYASPLVMVMIALFMRPLGERIREEYRRDSDGSYRNSNDSFFDRDNEPFAYMMSRLLTDGGSVFKNILKNFIAPYVHVLFNLFLAVFWIGHMQGGMSEAAQIAFVIPSAYSMYYYPFVLIKNAVKRHNKVSGITAGVIVLLSFGVFLAFYDQLIAMGGAIGIAVLFTALTVFGTLALLFCGLAFSVKKRKHIIMLVLYGLLLIAVIVAAAVILPGKNADRYAAAEQCVANGDYRQARVLFAELGSYEDAADRYAAIQFVELQVGEQVTLGTQTDAPDDLYGENPLTWTVVSVEDGKALLFCDAILTSIDSNPLSLWADNNSVRNALNSLYGLFDEGEQARILSHTYTVKTEDGTAEVTDKLFLFSRAELEKYCSVEQIFAENDTTYNDHQVLDYQMADFDYTYIYTYYVRDMDDQGAWVVADCESDSFTSKGNAYRYVGIRPAIYISMDEVVSAK